MNSAKKDVKENKEHKHLGPEAPYSHYLQLTMPIIFLVVWGLDSFVYHFTDFLNHSTSLILRLALFVTTLALSFLIMYVAHTKISTLEDNPDHDILTQGIFSVVRHPLYLSTILIYLAFVFLSLSILSMVIFIFIVIGYDLMASYEETSLEKELGDEYRRYKKQTPKWIPKFW